MKPSSPPLLTIGLPVFNGENYITEAVDSILSQSFRHLELIIADNCSTDGTEKICRNFERWDSRVRFMRNDANLGAAENFNMLVSKARGKYFKWAAHDDELAPGYIEKCIEALERNREAVACHTQTEVIDEKGQILGRHLSSISSLSSGRPEDRFSWLIQNDRHCHEVFGIMRKDVLEKTSLIGPFVASDRILRAELGLRGSIMIIDEPLFRNRHHPARSICAMEAHHQRGEWFTPKLRGKSCFRTGGFSLNTGKQWEKPKN